MVMIHKLRAEEERQSIGRDNDDNPIFEPWQEVSCDVFADKSLVETISDLPDSSVQDVRSTVTEGVRTGLNWSFKTEPSGTNPFIVDVVQDDRGKIFAIMEWVYQRKDCNAINGNDHVEARATLELNENEAGMITDIMNKRIIIERLSMQERETYQLALAAEGLDDASINEKREACLRAAGLDRDSISAAQDDFYKKWREVRSREN